MATPPASNLPLFRSLFRARPDVFTIRWEKGGKSGYTPAYQYDPYLYRQHKLGGGTFQNFSAKSYLPLTDEQMAKHLNGEHLAGIYPLLPDNTSWLLAADFDEKNWAEECRAFLPTPNLSLKRRPAGIPGVRSVFSNVSGKRKTRRSYRGVE